MFACVRACVRVPRLPDSPCAHAWGHVFPAKEKEISRNREWQIGERERERMNEARGRESEGGWQRKRGKHCNASDPVTLPCLSLSFSPSSYPTLYPLPPVSIYRPSLFPPSYILNLDPLPFSKISNADFVFPPEPGHLTVPFAGSSLVFFHSRLHLSREENFPGKQSHSLESVERDRITVIHPRPWVGNGFFCMGKKRSRDGLRRRRGQGDRYVPNVIGEVRERVSGFEVGFLCL